MQSAVVNEKAGGFQHILRMLNTNVDGRRKVAFALTAVKGCGRRYASLACRKADIDTNKRAGELSPDELDRLVQILQNPTQYKIPTWFLNRQKVRRSFPFSAAFVAITALRSVERCVDAMRFPLLISFPF